MQSDLQAKAVEILTQIQEAVAKTTNFALEQLPDVVMQYMIYARIMETLYVAIPAALIALCVYIGLYFSRIMRNETPFDRWFVMGIISIPATGLVITFLSRLDSFVMVWFAPKVYLLTKLVEIVR